MEPEPFTPSDWREWRRMQAWQLNQLGWKQCDIAVALNASKGAVSQWLSAARQDGPCALLRRFSPGHPCRLSAEQQRLIPDFLWHGAEAYGFHGEVWTCDRVVRVIEVEFGVTYSASQVSRLLRKLNWTPQI